MKTQWQPFGGGGGTLAGIWVNDPLKVGLLKATHVPNPDTQQGWTDVKGDEIPNGNGYTTGGVLLAGKSAPYNAAADRFDLIAADVAWGQQGGPYATFDAAFAYIYDSNTNWLWVRIDFEGQKSVANGVFTLDFDPTGILSISALAPV